MKPSKTCYVIRSILKHLSSEIRTDANGVALHSVQPDPREYDDPFVFRTDWLSYNLARKREVAGDGLSEKALQGFLECELINASNNGMEYPLSTIKTLYIASQICEEILGSEPKLSDVYDNCSFTGGASTSRKRVRSHAALKWWARPPLHVTPLALKHLIAFKQRYEAIDACWDDPGLLSMVSAPSTNRPFYEVVPGSRFSTVPKDSTTDRTILVEPDGNMLIQRGIGVTIRDLLRRKVNIDLRSQKRNQDLAYEGSVNESYATIDLKDASNRLYSQLLCMVLPPAWYELLYEVRSFLTRLPNGSWHRLEMMSSMGNGYTFEVESLLFYCLSAANARELKGSEKTISIFGDDIIVETAQAARLVTVLSDVGLSVNITKSFIDGPFRESCGKHFFKGVNVTPFFIKKELSDDSETIRVVNQLHRWFTFGSFIELEGTELSCVLGILSTVDVKNRNQVPMEYDNKCGLYSSQYSHPMKIRWDKRRKLLSVVFNVLVRETINGPVVDDELLWLYNHMTNRGTGQHMSIIHNTVIFDDERRVPFSVCTEGDLMVRRVEIPAHHAGPIP